MKIGAIELPGVGFVLLPIHEYRNKGPCFRVDNPGGGSHLLSATDVRSNWDFWVRDLVSDEDIVASPPPGVEVY